MNRPAAALIGAVALAIAAPLLVLGGQPSEAPPVHPITLAPITPSPAGSLDAVLARSLFADDHGHPPGPAEAAAGGDPSGGGTDAASPQIVGIVGRLPDQAVVLVRRPSGGIRTLGRGETTDGWRLESIAADAVLFVRGDRQERVEVSAGGP